MKTKVIGQLFLILLTCMTLTMCSNKTNVITQKKEMGCFKQVSGNLLTDTTLQNRTDLDFSNDTDMWVTVRISCPKVYLPIIMKEITK